MHGKKGGALIIKIMKPKYGNLCLDVVFHDVISKSKTTTKIKSFV